jgi:hypothetical protein
LSIPAMMQARTDFDSGVGKSVVDRVRESPRKYSTQITVGDRTHLGRRNEQLEHAPQFVLKLEPETCAFAVIPARRMFNVARSARRKRNGP